MARPVVAAICYRRKGGKIKFLLVRTTGRKYWTFPKGHVEKAELPWAAAQREAREEAGVIGTIKNKPFTSYAYSKGEPAREDIVDAYLLSVESRCKPKEPKRMPRWFAPVDAVKKLAKGRREEKYALEHLRVIACALAKLG